MAQQIQIRRGSAAAWSSADPTPAEGELCYETDTGVLKIGDGTTVYSSLSEFTSGSGGGSMTAGEILAALVTVDGPGSGLNADLLDGYSSADFALSGHNHSATYQPLDADLTALAAAGNSSVLAALDSDLATLSLPASTTISSFAKTLLDDTDAATARTTLGMGAASETAAGIVELATDAEAIAGTDTARALTPANGAAAFAASDHSHVITIAIPYEKLIGVEGDLAVESIPYRLYFKRDAEITNVYATVGTAPTGAAIRIDVNKNGTTIFTTQGNRPEIAVSTFSDMTSTPDVVAVTAGDYLTVDIDVIGSTVAGADLTVGIEYEETV